MTDLEALEELRGEHERLKRELLRCCGICCELQEALEFYADEANLMAFMKDQYDWNDEPTFRRMSQRAREVLGRVKDE